MWEFPKIRGTLFGGPYNKDPTKVLLFGVLDWGPLFSETPKCKRLLFGLRKGFVGTVTTYGFAFVDMDKIHGTSRVCRV